MYFQQLLREKKSLEDKVAEFSAGLADEEDKVKQLAKTKAKQEAIIADYEQQMTSGEKVLRLSSFKAILFVYLGCITVICYKAF